MAEFASKGVAGTGLGLGIAGTALGLLAGGLSPLTATNTCSEDHLVSRYELEQQETIAKLQSDIALRDANTYNDQKMLEMYKYLDSQLKDIRSTQNDKWTSQAVINCQVSSGLDVLNSQATSLANTLSAITKTAVPTSAICNFNATNCSNGNI